MITENLRLIHENIENACKKSKRDPNEITLIAVSKTYPTASIEEALSTGQIAFGENKVQELLQKKLYFDQNSVPIEWHLIGHLQTNKVKSIIGKTKLIHSVDSLKLAMIIQKESQKQNICTDILLEVNMANEETKYGFTISEIDAACREISQLSNLHIKGLMTIAPFVDNPEDNRLIFKKMKKLSVDIMAQNNDNTSMQILSMGMSNDYQVAIEEGATMIRIGTDIFGKRNYNI